MPKHIPIFQIDAFTSHLFRGNPAAVCLLGEWPSDQFLQSVASENNLSETAFLVPLDAGHYQLRWFTPTTEVELCGHATLASAFVLWNRTGEKSDEIRFETSSGTLKTRRKGAGISLDLPAWHPEPFSDPPSLLLQSLGREPSEMLRTLDAGETNYVLVYDNENSIRSLRPDLRRLADLEKTGVIVTSPGDRSDIVSRYFAPAFGIDEDPVTGAIHCAVVPYWSRRLNKTELTAHQASLRGGDLICEFEDDRVILTGEAVPYLEGHLNC